MVSACGWEPLQPLPWTNSVTNPQGSLHLSLINLRSENISPPLAGCSLDPGPCISSGHLNRPNSLYICHLATWDQMPLPSPPHLSMVAAYTTSQVSGNIPPVSHHHVPPAIPSVRKYPNVCRLHVQPAKCWEYPTFSLSNIPLAKCREVYHCLLASHT